MMRRTQLVIALALAASAGMVAVPTASSQDTSPTMFDVIAESRKVIDALGAGKFEDVEARFSTEMAQALPAGQLATAWGQLTSQAGKLTELGEPTVEDRDGVRVVVFPATYEQAPLNLILAWTADHKLGGLLAQPRT